VALHLPPHAAFFFESSFLAECWGQAALSEGQHFAFCPGVHVFGSQVFLSAVVQVF
jgi:hypothetical protein